MGMYPGDIDSRRTDSRACAIVHYQIDSSVWDYKTIAGHDVGTDCELELSEEGEWRGKKIEIQIKGTRHIENYLIDGGNLISFKLAKETIRYALGKAVPFFLFVVDVVGEQVYFVELHQYFIGKVALFSQLNSSTKTMRIHVSMSSTLGNNADSLVASAASVYHGGATLDLQEIKVSSRQR